MLKFEPKEDGSKDVCVFLVDLASGFEIQIDVVETGSDEYEQYIKMQNDLTPKKQEDDFVTVMKDLANMTVNVKNLISRMDELEKKVEQVKNLGNFLGEFGQQVVSYFPKNTE